MFQSTAPSPARQMPAPLDSQLPPPVLSLRNVSCGYDDRPILQGITLDVCEGEIFVIIGGSGSGKTTLLRTMIGFAQLLAGDICILGETVTGYRESRWTEVRAHMGFVFQKAALFDSLTVYENVAFPLVERHREMTRRQVAERVFNIVDAVNLAGYESNYPNELSGGMQKRVGVARALIDRPQILMYDEPTSGLDPLMTAQIDALILQTRQQFQVSSIVVSHDMTSVWRIADRIAVLLDRQLKALGTPEEIREHPDPDVQRFIHGQLPPEHPLAKVLRTQAARGQPPPIPDTHA
ncbi:MAG: ATP-binding cassette domain-containing protein [bacterium]